MKKTDKEQPVRDIDHLNEIYYAADGYPIFILKSDRKTVLILADQDYTKENGKESSFMGLWTLTYWRASEPPPYFVSEPEIDEEVLTRREGSDEFEPIEADELIFTGFYRK